MALDCVFEPLDGTSQVIYHSLRRFVLLSKVAGNAWNLNLALKASPDSDSPGSCWWQAIVTERNILNLAEEVNQEPRLESIVQRIQRCIEESEISLSGFNEDSPSDVLKVTFGTQESHPISFDLDILPHDEALASAVDFAFSLSLKSGTRKRAAETGTKSFDDHPSEPSGKRKNRDREDLVKEVKKPRTESAGTRQRILVPQRLEQEPPPRVTIGKATGSKANPTRAKRVAKKMQFESDEE